MCKHFENAQVSIRTQCCRKWYDCPECHAEQEDHPLKKTVDITFICKKCKKAFRKDLSDFDETDQYCPHCDNEYIMPSAASRKPVVPVKENLVTSHLDKISSLDPRMIRDSDLDINDEELLGFEPDYSARLG